MKKLHNHENCEVKYEVLFGPKKESERECKTFYNIGDAIDFFYKKEKDFHVDVYKITTIVNREKIINDRQTESNSTKRIRTNQ